MKIGSEMNSISVETLHSFRNLTRVEPKECDHTVFISMACGRIFATCFDAEGWP